MSRQYQIVIIAIIIIEGEKTSFDSYKFWINGLLTALLWQAGNGNTLRFYDKYQGNQLLQFPFLGNV